MESFRMYELHPNSSRLNQSPAPTFEDEVDHVAAAATETLTIEEATPTESTVTEHLFGKCLFSCFPAKY